MIRRARRILAGILFGAAAWWLLEPFRRRRRSPRLGVGVGAHGERYELRVVPLDPLETRAALELERAEYVRAWSGAGVDDTPDTIAALRGDFE